MPGVQRDHHGAIEGATGGPAGGDEAIDAIEGGVISAEWAGGGHLGGRAGHVEAGEMRDGEGIGGERFRRGEIGGELGGIGPGGGLRRAVHDMGDRATGGIERDDLAEERELLPYLGRGAGGAGGVPQFARVGGGKARIGDGVRGQEGDGAGIGGAGIEEVADLARRLLRCAIGARRGPNRRARSRSC